MSSASESAGPEISDTIRSLIIKLFHIGAVKFGTFTLKSGLISPVYFDLRLIVSYPELMKTISTEIGSLFPEEVDLVCGVPYTALPIATLVSVERGIPMVLRRKEQKTYGTGNLLEGDFQPEKKCLIIEDVVTSGSSVVETATVLRKAGLLVEKAAVVLDRGQGASIVLDKNNIEMKALIKVEDLLKVLEAEGLLDPDVTANVLQFAEENQVYDKPFEHLVASRIIPKVVNQPGLKIFNSMMKKMSNLCLSVDLDNFEDVISAVDLLGPKLCAVKTHVDTYGLRGAKEIHEFWTTMKELSEKHEFVLMEDRKFADIGSTTEKQLRSGPFEIGKWVDLVTVQGTPGPGILSAVKKISEERENTLGAILIAEMSSEGTLSSKVPNYRDLVFEVAEVPDLTPFVTGFVAQSRLKSRTNGTRYFIHFTPGVSLNEGAAGDGLGQQYNSVESAIIDRGADIIIVGRGILNEKKADWLTTAENFRAKGWRAWKERVNKEYQSS